MIRDFCDIRERTLFKEIETLEARLGQDDLPRGVEPETIEAMRAVKNVDNIGAHMTLGHLEQWRFWPEAGRLTG